MRSGTAQRLAGLFFVICAAVIPAWAQYSTSTLIGTVRGEDGKPLPSTRIEWEQEGQLRSLLTDSDGNFTSHFVEPGIHTFRFEHESTNDIGSFRGMVPAGSSLVLSVVLHPKGGSDGSNYWRVREELPGPPDVWIPGSFLTKEQMMLLPGTEHLWSFLNQIEPSVITDRFDISGLHSDAPFRIGVRGSSWSQNQGSVNGMSVNHPSGDGMLVFPDMAAMEAIVYSVGESPTQHTGPGAHVDLIPKTGSRELHGEARIFFQSGALQDTNVSARYRSFYIGQSDERWKHFFNGGFQLAGPAGKSPWTYFVAVSGRDLSKWVRTQPFPITANVGQQTFNFAGTVTPKDRVGVYISLQHRNEPRYGASTQVSWDSSVNQKQNYRSVQGSWSHEVSARSVLDVKLGMTHSRVDQRFQNGVQGQSAQDLFAGYVVDGISPLVPGEAGYKMLNNTVRGPAPMAENSEARISSASTTYSMVRRGLWNSSHRIVFGGSYSQSKITEDATAVDNVNLLYFMVKPDSVRLLSTPAHTRDRMDHLGFYASDNVSISRLSLLGEISVDGSRTANVLQSGQSANDLRWRNVGGRIGAAFQLIRRVVLRTSLAEIYDQPNLATAAAFNPEGIGAQTYAWNDANGDDVFQPGENTRLLKVTGGPYTRMDPNLKNPRTSELTIGIAQSGLHGFNTEFYGFRRTVHRMMSLVNEGVPFSAYTPTLAIDPGWDAVLGSDDDRTITVFNQDPQTLGHDSYLLTNPAGFQSHSEGFEFSVGVNSPLVQAKATVTRYRSVAETGPGLDSTGNDTGNLLGVFDDPNKAILARGSTFFDRGTLVRMWTTAKLPWGFRISAVGNYQDGLPYARVLAVPLNQGTIGVLMSQRGPGESGTIGGQRTTHYQTIDMRLSKHLALGNGSLLASLDIFNLSNLALTLVQAEVTSRTAYWRVPIQFQTPRSIQPGLRYTW